MKYLKTMMILGVFFAFSDVYSQDENEEIEEVVTVSAKQPVPIDEVVANVTESRDVIVNTKPKTTFNRIPTWRDIEDEPSGFTDEDGNERF